jgi:hypothetical protein
MERPTLEIAITSRDDAGATRETRITVGAPTHADVTDTYFARVSGVNATFAVPRRAVVAILDAW